MFFKLDSNVRQLDVDGLCALVHIRCQVWKDSQNGSELSNVVGMNRLKHIFIIEFAIRKKDALALYPNDPANRLKLISYFQLLSDLFVRDVGEKMLHSVGKSFVDGALVLNIIEDGRIFFMDCDKGVVFKEEFYSVHQGAHPMKIGNDVFQDVKGF